MSTRSYAPNNLHGVKLALARDPPNITRLSCHFYAWYNEHSVGGFRE